MVRRSVLDLDRKRDVVPSRCSGAHDSRPLVPGGSPLANTFACDLTATSSKTFVWSLKLSK
jgi:hypothetical protein